MTARNTSAFAGYPKGGVRFSFVHSYVGNKNGIVAVAEREDAKHYNFDLNHKFLFQAFSVSCHRSNVKGHI